jgi:hypothetical protein
MSFALLVRIIYVNLWALLRLTIDLAVLAMISLFCGAVIINITMRLINAILM